MSLPRREGRDLASVNSDQILYAEDLAVGDWMDLGPVEVTRDEIIDFARRFDPLPIHIDGTDSPFGDVMLANSDSVCIPLAITSPNGDSVPSTWMGSGSKRRANRMISSRVTSTGPKSIQSPTARSSAYRI